MKCVDEYNEWWSLDYFNMEHLIYKFTIDMVKLGNIYSKDPSAPGSVPITMEYPLLQKWMKSTRVSFTLLNKSLFDKLYDEIESVQNGNRNLWQTY